MGARRVTRDIRSESAAKRASRSHDGYQTLVLAAIARSCPDALICTDLEGIVTSWNDCATRMFGYILSNGQSRNFFLTPAAGRRSSLPLLTCPVHLPARATGPVPGHKRGSANRPEPWASDGGKTARRIRGT